MTTWGDQHLVPKAPWNCSVVYVWVPLPSRGLLGTQPHSPAPPPHCCPNPGLWVGSWEPDSKPQASHQGRLVCLWPGKQGREGKAVPSGALTASSLVCGQEDQRKPVTVGEHERLSKCFQILSSVGTISTNICFHFYKVPPLPQVPHSSNPS